MTVQDRNYRPGELIFSENEPDTHIYIIKQGRIEIMTRNPFYVLDGTIKVPGDLLGVMTAICGLACKVSARAVEPSLVTVCDVADFNDLIRNKPVIALKIVSSLSAIVRELNNHIMKHLNSSEEKKEDDKFFDIGAYFMDRGEHEKAEYVFRRCDEIYGQDKGLSEKSLFKLGEIYELTHDLDNARKTYQELIDRFPLDKRITRVANSILKRLEPQESLKTIETEDKPQEKGLLSLIKSAAKDTSA